jgi:hypothetical protein
MYSELEENRKKQHPKEIPVSFLFDMVRAIMYISVSVFLFTTDEFNSYLGFGFIKAFATVAGIYGVFRLVRALITLDIIKLR